MKRELPVSALLWPLLFGTLALVILPALVTLLMALFHYDALSAPRWAGIENLAQLFADPVFKIALRNSLWVALVAVPLRMALALLLALLLHTPRREAGALRAAVVLPTAVPDLAWALLWLWILNPLYGPLAWLLPLFGIPADAWLYDPLRARQVIVLMLLFGIGELVWVLIAVRREVPRELYELCEVEGASRLTTFRRVTLPLLWPALLFLACRDAALTMQTTFVPGMIVTNGGPNFATTFLPLLVYQNGFEYLRFGYAAAQTVVMLGLTLLMMAVQIVLLRQWARTGA
ncbi:MAG: sugar ABC transporter permease [Pseudomonadota bacterium]